jgi:predicted nucleic acid-binding Zn ribbon protein
MRYPSSQFSPPLAWYKKVTPQQRILAEWRRVDLTDAEIARKPSAKPVSSIMGRVLKEVGLEERLSHLEILKVWNNLMDPRIVAHAQPTGLARGTLFVNVDSSVWMDEIIRYRRREILTRLQHSFGKDLIARISFRIG